MNKIKTAVDDICGSSHSLLRSSKDADQLTSTLQPPILPGQYKQFASGLQLEPVVQAAAEQAAQYRNLVSTLGTVQLSKWHMYHLLLFSKAVSGLLVPSSIHPIITCTCLEKEIKQVL